MQHILLYFAASSYLLLPASGRPYDEPPKCPKDTLLPQGERTNSRPGIELCNYEYGGTKNDVQSRECQFHVIFDDWEANDDIKCPLPKGYKVERKYALYEQCVDLTGPLENDKASSANVQGKICCVIYPAKGCKSEDKIKMAVVHNLDEVGKQRMAITGPDMASSLKCKKMEKAGDCDNLMTG